MAGAGGQLPEDESKASALDRCRRPIRLAARELLQGSPQEMADQMRKEAAKWAKGIRTANIQLD
jgi:hypothetical protein